MCLSTISKKRPKPEGIGYKVFVRCGVGVKRIRGEFSGGTRPIGKWLKARDPKIIGSTYKLGFHIFTRLSSVKQWHCGGEEVIFKVKYRKARLRGWQEYMGLLPVVVADEIYIMNEVK